MPYLHLSSPATFRLPVDSAQAMPQVSSMYAMSFLATPNPNLLTMCSNTLLVAVQVAAIFVGLFVKYTKRTRPSVFFGVPITILGQGLLIYFVSQDGGASNNNEASFVVAKVPIRIGLAFQGTGAQIAIQALVPQEDMPVATAVYFASMNLDGAIGAWLVTPLRIALYS